MASTVPRSQSNRVPLGCGGTEDVVEQKISVDHGCVPLEECFQHLVKSQRI